MGLFSSLFGSSEGSEKAAEVMKENAATIKAMAEKDQATRDAIIAGLTPDLTYANETDKSIIEQSMADAATARERGNVTWDNYMENVVPLQTQFYKEALDYGGLADQERAAGTAVSDVRQQYDTQKAINDRNLASMGINPNSGRFASADREAQLQAMATSAGAATKARTGARDTGIQLRKDATQIGQGLVDQTQNFGRLNLSANQLAGGLTNNFVNRGLAVGNFKVGGTGAAMNAINTAGGNYATALSNTDTTGLLPGLLGFGAAALTAPSTSWVGKKLS